MGLTVTSAVFLIAMPFCPQARWSDDLSRTAGRSWMRVAENRARWRDIWEAYVQQWTVIGWWWWCHFGKMWVSPRNIWDVSATFYMEWYELCSFWNANREYWKFISGLNLEHTTSISVSTGNVCQLRQLYLLIQLSVRILGGIHYCMNEVIVITKH
jgi:hypothetical protein